jgi:hypothetical protein
MAVNRDIKYLNKDFTSFRTSLIDFAKTYFPTTYNDFSAASPGMMFIEMASYVGDVLSFYLDNQIQETFIQYAQQPANLYRLAYMFNYRPKLTAAATTVVDFYQKIPALGGNPDFNYTLFIDANSQLKTADQTQTFILEEPINFAVSNSLDPTDITVFSVDGSNNVQEFLLKKSRKATSATVNTTTYTFTTPERFTTVELTADNYIGILDVVDSNGNIWYEVDYLAQDMVYEAVPNNPVNDPTKTATDAPNILKLKSVQRRFTARVVNDTTVQLQFGAGTTGDSDEQIVPNPDNVGLGLPYGQSKLTTAYDPTNFVFTNTYGIAPSNTTLTIRYLTGGGVTANIPANTLTTFLGTPTFSGTPTNTTTANDIFQSLAITNPQAATGGGDGDSIEEIRQNSLASYNTQLRAVTPDDYLIRVLSLPPKYGVVAKAYIQPSQNRDTVVGEIPTTLDLYTLTYDSDGSFKTTSNTLKQNIITYLSQYRVLGDTINVRDAFIINIQVEFEVAAAPNVNSNTVLFNCITSLQSYFERSKWQINQPIQLKDLSLLLDKVNGVLYVKNINITNKAGSLAGYSPYSYDIGGATRNNVIYPSLDPSIFEVKYPNSDITGKITTI